MASLYQEFSDEGLTMVAISNEDPEVVRDFLEDHPYPFSILLDPEDILALRFEVMALPIPHRDRGRWLDARRR